MTQGTCTGVTAVPAIFLRWGSQSYMKRLRHEFRFAGVSRACLCGLALVLVQLQDKNNVKEMSLRLHNQAMFPFSPAAAGMHAK